MDNAQSIWFIFLSFLLSEKSPRQDLQDLISITHRWTNYNWYFVVIRFKLNIVILRVRSKIITHALLNFTREKFYIAFTTKKRNNNLNNNQPSSAIIFQSLSILDLNRSFRLFQADYYKDAAHFRLVDEGSQYRLEIPYAKLDFTGTYSVIARNCHGEAKAVISLQIYAKGEERERDGISLREKSIFVLSGQGKEEKMKKSGITHG